MTGLPGEKTLLRVCWDVMRLNKRHLSQNQAISASALGCGNCGGSKGKSGNGGTEGFLIKNLSERIDGNQ